jgi:hypothetical protein
VSDAEHEVVVDNAVLRAELAAWHRAAQALLAGPHAAEVGAVLRAEGLGRAGDAWVLTGDA